MMKFKAERDRRAQPRFVTPPMLHGVAVRVIGTDRTFSRQGHAYNLSLSGALIEVDAPIAPGAEVAMILELPLGANVRATGRIVRLCDVDEPGPSRIAITFSGFATSQGRVMLREYLSGPSLRRCA